jgi:putative two-component system response regulator
VPAALLVGYLVGPFGATIGMPNDGLNAWLTRGIAFVTIGAVGGVLFDRMRAALALADEEARQLSERKREAIAIFARCAEAKDETTGHHVVRIAETARELARVAGLDAAAVDEISWSSMLHDVGKLHIPDHILTKPGRLTAEEWVIIQLHTVLGERILGTGHGFAVARRIARSHHENFDGTGYPDGLSHAEIPLEARIVRICDAFDAMTNKRPYSPATSVQHALEEIERFAGRQFDPELARAFIELVPRLDIHPLGDPASIAVAKGTLAAEGP